jgi:multidrug/hemolysin transport system ATP-binding protein
MEHVIEIRHLNKSFGEVRAVQDLSFHVRKGKIYGLLGRNGSRYKLKISTI